MSRWVDACLHLPLDFMGDFNALLYSHEKVGGRMVPNCILQEFQECLNRSDLRCIDRSGQVRTWNDEAIRKRVVCQLDRALGNRHWFDKFSHIIMEGLVAETSDHSPICVRFGTPCISRARPFRYNNGWNLLDGYNEAVLHGWQQEVDGHLQFQMVWRLKQVKKELKEWNKMKPFTDVGSSDRELREVQMKLQTDINNSELAEKGEAPHQGS